MGIHTQPVIPAKAGIQGAEIPAQALDPRFRGGDDMYLLASDHFRSDTKDLSLSHTPDTAEDSKPTAGLPLLLRPAAALQPRISAAERSRSLYFRCKKQQKQLVHRAVRAFPAKAGIHFGRGHRLSPG